MGKEYKRRFKNNYLKFLKLCRECSEKSDISFIGVILQSMEWKNQYIPFVERVIKSVYEKNGVGDSEFITSAKMLAAPLITIQNQMKYLSSDNHIEIVIDSHRVTENFGDMKIEVSSSIGPTTISSTQLLNLFYNGYRKLQFPNSPTLIENGISVQSDKNFLLDSSF